MSVDHATRALAIALWRGDDWPEDITQVLPIIGICTRVGRGPTAGLAGILRSGGEDSSVDQLLDLSI